MITANVIADSIGKLNSVRVTTLELVYPRLIHSEFMTHRVFSRNASSSRAIPIERMLKSIEENPAMPVHWGVNKAGMQAHEELDIEAQTEAIAIWKEACDAALTYSKELADLGVHKQIANRITEPFQHIKVLVTATDWQNFFDLRDHKDAQPEIQALAQAMRKALNESTPKLLEAHEWHTPYITEDEKANVPISKLLKISSARCARVSYNNFDGTKTDAQKDLDLFIKLAGSKPIHASALEHVCVQDLGAQHAPTNFRGYLQYRRVVEAQMEKSQE